MSTPAQPTYPFDARPLTEPIDAKAAAEFARTLRQRYSSGPTAVKWIILSVVVGLFVAVPILITVIGVIAFGITSGEPFVGTIFSVPVIFVVLAAAISVPLIITARRRKQATDYRIARFAQMNNMEYKHTVPAPRLPGMIFHVGSGRVASRLVRGRVPRFVEFGNYSYTTGSGKNQTTHNWGYVAVKLDVPLPNIVLDALGNNTLGTNLPASFSRDQRLSLEGDFDRFFTLYCPRGYEADALYLFTPDIMARFIDNAAQLDVEIVDDWMFLYIRRPASTTDAATWAWLFSTVGALMSKFDQWARWRDDRLREAQAAAAQHPQTASAPAGVAASLSATPPALPFAPPAGLLAPPPGVALQGRRLKKGVRWGVVVFFIVFVVIFIAPQIIGFFSVFSSIR